MTSWTTSVKSLSDVRCCRTASQSSAIVGNLPPEARPLVYGCTTHCTKRYGRHTHTPGRLDVRGRVGVRGPVGARVRLEERACRAGPDRRVKYLGEMGDRLRGARRGESRRDLEGTTGVP